MSREFESNHERVAYERQVAIFRAMTPARKLDLAMAMNRSMGELMAAGFRQRNPEWTETQIKQAVAERRLYARTG